MNAITKNFSAVAWFEFQKQSNVIVIDVETVRIDGEKLVRATFQIS